jgi:hypothetical protein
LNDISINFLQTNATDQSVCRQCHLTSGTNVNSSGYNNTVGGVPTRHHSLLPRNVINPLTNSPFGCPDCHPSTPGVGNGILLDRSCVDCHNGTNFYADTTLGAHVGNFSRPHHILTNYTSVVGFGNPAADRQCKKCHGSFVDNYNDSHYVPSYATDMMITPFASFKATNFSQPDGLGNQGGNINSNHTVDPSPTGGFKVWGGCYSCHLSNYNATPQLIGSNHDNHHLSILGSGRIGGTGHQTDVTPFNLSGAPGGRQCFVCHVVNTAGSPLEITVTSPFTGELLTNAMEVRNSTVESTSAIEPGTTNITFNGTGCEKCHSVSSLHSIQFNYSQNGPQGLGHINNNLDCSGCHDEWLPANTFVAGALVPAVNSVSPSVIVAGTATTLIITGVNFVNDPYTSVVSVDGVLYNPTSITDTQIVVSIPGLTAGSHQLQVVKDGTTNSKLSILTAVPSASITSAKLAKQGKNNVLTILGVGFGSTKPVTNAQLYVTANHAGAQITSTTVSTWADTKITVTVPSNIAKGDIVTVLTSNLAGEVQNIIS